MGKTLLYYHKHDLRLHDNPILAQLQEQGKYTKFLPVYIFPPHQMELSSLLKSSVSKNPEKTGEVRSPLGSWRTGKMRVKYLCETIWDLKKSYEKIGTELLIKAGRSEKILPALIEAIKAEDKENEVELWVQDEYTTEEVNEFKKIRKAVEGLAELKQVEDNTLVSIENLPYDISKLPNFYTEFRKSVEPLDHVTQPYATPKSVPPRPSFKDIDNQYEVPSDLQEIIETLCRPLGGPPAKVPDNTAHPFTGGETTALKRLDYYLSGGKNAPAAHYKETRNEMLGPDFSTKFSSFLSLGAISPRTIHYKISAFEQENGLEGDQNTYWIRFELLWRDYFKFIGLKYGSKLFLKEGLKQKPIRDKWLGPDSLEARRWKEGTTGVGIVDAAMRELNATGYMSNRTRQIVASFLCKDLYVDWRVGAEHFEERLLDHDAASNWGNWQYQAGVGNDPRGSRRFNPGKQTHDYDPQGKYIKTWCPEIKDVTDKNGFTYFWNISESQQHALNISELPAIKNPIKGLCGNDKRHDKSSGVGGGRGGHGGGGRGNRGGKQRRGEGRPRRTGPSDKMAAQDGAAMC